MKSTLEKITLVELALCFDHGKRTFENLLVTGSDSNGCASVWLRGCVFQNCRFSQVRMPGAYLEGSSFLDTRFYRCDLQQAQFSKTIFNQVSLRSCNLAEARMEGLQARGLVLKGGSIENANLHGADLRGCQFAPRLFTGLNVANAQFYAARMGDNFDPDKVITSYFTLGLEPAPEGELVLWGWKSARLVEMLVPRDARRSQATTRKLRAEYIITRSIDGDTTPGLSLIHNHPGSSTTYYVVGQETHCDRWDSCRWHECSGGIHGFQWQADAKTWTSGPTPSFF